MAALIWDVDAEAWTEPEIPLVYDKASDAFVETAGLVWDADAQAWTESWGQKVSAYVYGAVSETVTIKRNGIIVATVATDADGVSNEQIELACGTYTLTGSVSGWTEEQTVDRDTTKFRAMPEGSLYWYGIFSQPYIFNKEVNGPSLNLQTNSFGVSGGGSSALSHSSIATANDIDISKYTKLKILHTNSSKIVMWGLHTESKLYSNSDYVSTESIAYGTNGSTNVFDISPYNIRLYPKIHFCGADTSTTIYSWYLE